MTNPVTDVLGAGRAGALLADEEGTDGAASVAETVSGTCPTARPLRTGKVFPIYPSSEKAGLTSWDLGQWVEETLRRAGQFADPLPEEHRRRLGLGRGPGHFGGFTSRRTWATCRPPAGAWPSTSSCACSSPSRSDARRWPETPGAFVTRSTSAPMAPDCSRASSARFPSSRPAPNAGRSRTSSATWRVPCPCTACSKVMSARARPWSHWPRSWAASKAATKERSWRRPRCWRSSTTWGSASWCVISP